MDHSTIETRYERILQDWGDDFTPLSKEAERRGAPRIPVSAKGVTAQFAELGIKIEIDVQTQDISTSGVCFLSERPFKAGGEFEISVSRVFSLHAVVVSCEMEETDANLMEVRYRVRCRFSNERQGMEMLVLAKETEAGELKSNG